MATQDNPVANLMEMCFPSLFRTTNPCVDCESPTDNGRFCRMCESMREAMIPPVFPIPFALMDTLRCEQEEHYRLAFVNLHLKSLYEVARVHNGELTHPTYDISMEQYERKLREQLFAEVR